MGPFQRWCNIDITVSNRYVSNDNIFISLPVELPIVDDFRMLMAYELILFESILFSVFHFHFHIPYYKSLKRELRVFEDLFEADTYERDS